MWSSGESVTKVGVRHTETSPVVFTYLHNVMIIIPYIMAVTFLFYIKLL